MAVGSMEDWSSGSYRRMMYKPFLNQKFVVHAYNPGIWFLIIVSLASSRKLFLRQRQNFPGSRCCLVLLFYDKINKFGLNSKKVSIPKSVLKLPFVLTAAFLVESAQR